MTPACELSSPGSVGIGWPGTHIMISREAAPGVPQIVRRLIVDDVAARLPERLSSLNDPLGLALQLEDHLALEHVTEHWARVPVRRSARVARRYPGNPGHDRYREWH
jgi:hypothetical protein